MSRMKADGTVDGRSLKKLDPHFLRRQENAAKYAAQMETPDGGVCIDPQTGDLLPGFTGIVYEPPQWGLVNLKTVAALIGG